MSQYGERWVEAEDVVGEGLARLECCAPNVEFFLEDMHRFINGVSQVVERLSLPSKHLP